jgi:hypothetical protein
MSPRISVRTESRFPCPARMTSARRPVQARGMRRDGLNPEPGPRAYPEPKARSRGTTRHASEDYGLQWRRHPRHPCFLPIARPASRAAILHPSGPTAGGLLSFRRIVDIPFEKCVAALENLQGDGQDDDLHTGQSLLRGPIEHDRDTGTCRLEVRLARGPLRPPLRMRLELDRWSSRPARTRLELIPCRRLRPTTTYFRAGHLLLDSVIHWLRQYVPEQRFTVQPWR